MVGLYVGLFGRCADDIRRPGNFWGFGLNEYVMIVDPFLDDFVACHRSAVNFSVGKYRHESKDIICL